MQIEYEAKKAFDAKLVYDVWLRLVRDEELYDAMLEGKHPEVARARGMGDEEILILDDFRCQPGTKWHVENLRFRCATIVCRTLGWHLPGTMHLLTNGIHDWQFDLCYEYLAVHRWAEMGYHLRFQECERFAAFAKNRLARRRVLPDHFDEVLELELAAIQILKAAGDLPSQVWPAKEGATPEVPPHNVRPRRGPADRLIRLSMDVLPWVLTPEGDLPAKPEKGPLSALVFVPSPQETHRFLRLTDDALPLFEACQGKQTVGEILASPAFARDRVGNAALIRGWLEARALV